MTAEILTKTIPAEFAGLRLDQALARLFPDYSRSRLKHWLLSGAVTVDGGQLRPKDKVDGGELVELRAEPETLVATAPEPLPIDVVYEDDALMVIDKPAGLVVHPGAGNPGGTLMNGLLHHAPALVDVPRAGIVHRIDKDTTGLLLIAKTLPAHTALVRSLGERGISRDYAAVCRGVLTGGGTIREPVGRHPVDRTRMAVVSGARPAVTHYTVRERFRGHTLVDVRLETGRTHQIRVHFAHRRQPLVGDPVYGGRAAVPAGASAALARSLRNFRRQALHAERLALEHPVTGEKMTFESPLPADFAGLIAALREDAACT